MLALLTVAVLVTADDRPDRPNVILCMADDQGWGDVGYAMDGYGGHPVLRTPVLDAMAAGGLRFDRFYAAAPVCSPTRGSVLTGRNPNRFGDFSWGRTLRPREVTLAEALKTAGYRTGHFGKWHLGPVRAGDPVSPGGSGFDTWVSSPNFYENSPLFSDEGRVIETAGESSMVTVEAALPFLRDAADAGEPFLAVIWFGNPHTPHEPTAELAAEYAGQPTKLRNYLAEMAGIDRAMGRLRDELDTLGVRDDTLLWYTSDNGARPPGSTGGLRGIKGQLWEGGLRVPAVIEWPGRIAPPRGTTANAVTSDIYPTVLELAGVTVEDQPPLDGVSLVPLIDGAAFERSEPVGFWQWKERGVPTKSAGLLEAMRAEQERLDRPAPAENVDRSFLPDEPVPADHRAGHAAWLDGRWKLHRVPRNKAGTEFREELYDLHADPTESDDVAAQQPERVAAMRAALEEWQRSVVASYNVADY